MDEKWPQVGQSPYSASKIAADQLAISFYRSFHLPVKIVRPFNTYGPRQSARAIIPTIITQLLNEKKPLKLGNIYVTRDLTFVKDTVGGFINIAESDELWGEITNIGMNTEITIGDLANTIAKLLDINLEIEIEEERVRPDESEVRRLFCDNSKIKKYTNWQPNYNIEEGLQKTIEWIRGNMGQFKPEIYNV